MKYEIDDTMLQILLDTHNLLNQIQVTGAQNAGLLFNSVGRIEQFYNQAKEKMIIEENEKPSDKEV